VAASGGNRKRDVEPPTSWARRGIDPSRRDRHGVSSVPLSFPALALLTANCATPLMPDMPVLSAEDAAVRQRTIAHMNADHPDSVSGRFLLVRVYSRLMQMSVQVGRYVEHLKGASSLEARNAKLTDVALDQLTISNGTATWRISLEPPMRSMRDARERLIQMDNNALKALNRSDITVKEYRGPRGFHLFIFVACLTGYTAFLRKQHFAPGSLLYGTFHQYIPAVIDTLRESYPLGLVLMVGIHLVEAAGMIRTRLTKHSVPLFSRLWWTWVVSTFIEGFGAFQRLDFA
jgi:hypothetical protein